MEKVVNKTRLTFHLYLNLPQLSVWLRATFTKNKQVNYTLPYGAIREFVIATIIFCTAANMLPYCMAFSMLSDKF